MSASRRIGLAGFRLSTHVVLMFLAVATARAEDNVKVEVVPQIQHSNFVTSVAVSPSGRHVVSGSADKTLRLWDVATGRLIRVIEGHALPVTAVAFSPDERSVASGSADKTLKLWDVATGKLVRSFEGHSDTVTSIAYSRDGRSLVSGSWDKTLRLWDVATGRLLHTFKGHANTVESVAFSPDGGSIVSGSADKTLRLWNVATGDLLLTLIGHSDTVNSVAYAPDGHSVVSGSGDHTIKFWDAATGNVLRTLDGHLLPVSSIAVSPDGRSVVSGSWDKTLKLWEASTGKLLRTFVGHSDTVNSVGFSPDGLGVYSGSLDRTIKQWDTGTGRLLRTFDGLSSLVECVAFSPDGRRVVSGGADNVLRLWDAGTGKLLQSFIGHSDLVTAIAYSPDGRGIISGSADKTLRLWDVATGNLLRTFVGHSDTINSVAYAPDGKSVVSGSDDHTIKLWDTATGGVLRTFVGHSDTVNSVAYAPDGRSVVSGSGDHTVKLWNATTGQLLRTFMGYWSYVASVAFSPDGRTVVSGNWDNTVRLWDVATGRLLRTFNGHSGAVTSVAFSPDGRNVASGSWDKTLRLWDVATGKPLQTYDGHSDVVNSIAYAPDGRSLVSGSADTTVRFWTRPSGLPILELLASRDGAWLALTPAGYYDLGGNGEDLLHLVYGTRVLSVGQTFDQLYRPDLVQAALNGDLDGRYTDAASKLNLETVLDSGPPPQLEHLADRDDRAGDTIRISLRITGTGGGVGNRIDWKVNGVGQGDPTPPALSSMEGSLASTVITQTLGLVPGRDNDIVVTAYNRAGIVASPALKIIVDKFGFASSRPPRMFVLALGVNNYRMTGYHLDYAAGDATSFARALEVVGRALVEVEPPSTLTNEQVTESGISSAFDKIADEAKPDDVFVLFLAGHGKSIGGKYYYLPQTIDFVAAQSVEKYGIGQDKWDAWLRKIPAQKSLIVIDTCDSAAFTASRGSDTARQTAMAQFQHATGRNIIAAARNAALEGFRDHGVLTYALLEALDIKAARGGDEEVRVGALASYVARRVPEITMTTEGVRQDPYLSLSGNDFPIGLRQPAVLEASGEAIPNEPTHVLIRAVLVRESPADDAKVIHELPANTLVRTIEFDGTWAIVARNGHKLGYVPLEALGRLQ
jgi:WD40 repeat protein